MFVQGRLTQHVDMIYKNRVRLGVNPAGSPPKPASLTGCFAKADFCNSALVFILSPVGWDALSQRVFGGDV